MNKPIRGSLKFLPILASLAALAVISVSGLLPAVAAAVSTPVAVPKISFTFDDGLASTYNLAQPIMAKYGLTGTDYVPTGCIGTTNYCPENPSAVYMTWPQVQAMQNTYGWEIGSHSVDTPCMASSAQTDPADCPNAQPLTTAQIDTELANSKSALASYGITATDFAPPYGDFNANVIAQVAKYYASMKQFQNTNNNTNAWPYSDYYLWDYPVLEATTPVSAVEAAINAAIANNQWLILTFHDIAQKPSQNPDNYQYGTSELDQIASYVQTKEAAGLRPIHVNQGLAAGSTNLLANSSFNSGISTGWTTDAPSNVIADSGTNGSYPDPKNAVKFTSSGTAEHLFSPKVAVVPSSTYLLKSYLNVQTLSAGEAGFYIDEYDANGNWISGQWKSAENSPFAESMSFSYKPSSANVSKAALQIYTTANPGITAYVDNAQWLPLSSPAPVNLMPNPCFASGIGAGWHTDDSVNIRADNASNGDTACNPTSVYMQSGATASNGHLLSPLLGVTPTAAYNLSAWLNIKQITNTASGEVGFYIDEYDANGNWISGQYKSGVKALGAGTVNFGYTPSSSAVSKAALQLIVIGNAGVRAYVDDINWSAAN